MSIFLLKNIGLENMTSHIPNLLNRTKEINKKNVFILRIKNMNIRNYQASC